MLDHEFVVDDLVPFKQTFTLLCTDLRAYDTDSCPALILPGTPAFCLRRFFN